MISDLVRKLQQGNATPSDMDALARALDDVERRSNILQGWMEPGGSNPFMRQATIGRLILTEQLLIDDGAPAISLEADGDAFFGSDINAPGTTSLVIFSNAQTYNGEAMGAGDVLLGDNSPEKANILWDPINEFQFRYGTDDFMAFQESKLKTKFDYSQTETWIDSEGIKAFSGGGVFMNAYPSTGYKTAATTFSLSQDTTFPALAFSADDNVWVAIIAVDGGQTVVSITHNTYVWTRAVAKTQGNVTIECWTAPAGDIVSTQGGTGRFVAGTINLSGSANVRVWATALANVNQTTPVSDTDSASGAGVASVALTKANYCNLSACVSSVGSQLLDLNDSIAVFSPHGLYDDAAMSSAFDDDGWSNFDELTYLVPSGTADMAVIGILFLASTGNALVRRTGFSGWEQYYRYARLESTMEASGIFGGPQIVFDTDMGWGSIINITASSYRRSGSKGTKWGSAIKQRAYGSLYSTYFNVYGQSPDYHGIGYPLISSYVNTSYLIRAMDIDGASHYEVNINDAGTNVDFRAEGDTDANLLFVDASADKIGIGDAAPGEKLDVAGNINATGVVKVDDVQVVGNRVVDARCDDAVNSGDATTDGVIDALRDAMIAHGLIAAA